MAKSTLSDILFAWPPVLCVYLGGYLITTLANIYFARVLSASDYGDFSVAVAVAALGVNVALLGSDRAAARVVPQLVEQGHFSELRGYFTHTIQVISVMSLLLIGLGVGFYGLYHRAVVAEHHPIIFGIIAIPFFAFPLFFSRTLASDAHMFSGALPYRIQQPASFLLIVYLLFSNYHAITDHMVLTAYIGAWVLVLMVLLWLWKRRYGFLHRYSKQMHRKAWMKDAGRFLFYSIILESIRNAGILLMEVLSHNEAYVGGFAAIVQSTALINILIASLLAVFSPRLAEVTDHEDSVHAHDVKLQCLQNQFNIIASLLAVVTLLFFVVYGRHILGWFNPQFVVYYPALIVQAVAGTLLLLTGVVVPALQYHNYHNWVNGSYIMMLVLMVLSGIVLIPWLGVMGAAMAYVIANAMVLSLLFFQAYRRFALLPFSLTIRRGDQNK